MDQIGIYRGSRITRVMWCMLVNYYLFISMLLRVKRTYPGKADYNEHEITH